MEEENHRAEADFKKEAVTPKVHQFYFVKIWPDPQLTAMIDEAEKEYADRNQERAEISWKLQEEKMRAKSMLIWQHTAEYYQRLPRFIHQEERILQELSDSRKRKNRRPFAKRWRSIDMCSTVEEIDDLIRRLCCKVQHGTNTLAKEKQLLEEIREAKIARENIIPTASKMKPTETLEARIESTSRYLERLKKSKLLFGHYALKFSEEELEAVKKEISNLEGQLARTNQKKAEAYKRILELKKLRDDKDARYFPFVLLVKRAKELAAKNDLSGVRDLSNRQVEEFMSEWRNDETFRDYYEKRVLQSLKDRRLSGDGRARRLEDILLALEDPSDGKDIEN